MAGHFIGECCKKGMDEIVEPVKELYDGIETVKGFR